MTLGDLPWIRQLRGDCVNSGQMDPKSHHDVMLFSAVLFLVPPPPRQRRSRDDHDAVSHPQLLLRLREFGHSVR